MMIRRPQCSGAVALLGLLWALGVGCTSPRASETVDQPRISSPSSSQNPDISPASVLREVLHLDGTEAHLARMQIVDDIVANALIKLAAGLNEDSKPSDESRHGLQKALSQKIRAIYADRSFTEDMIQAWSSTAQIEQLSDVRRHLQSALYQRYVARIAEIKTAVGQRQLGIFLIQTTRRGSDPVRANLARRWIQATQEHELIYLLSFALAEHIFAAAEPVLADWAGDSYRHYQEDIDARSEAFRAQVEKSLYAETLFAFERFSTAELQTLVAFWESTSGFGYVRKKMEVLGMLLDRAHHRFKTEMHGP